mmetsp:Transcript_114623/g.228106  ORF Transcript_114623/g.228106 Transcript_114623/m.228106 type:complete len:201 (-) Transcript_114623:397-999(-)
MKLSHVSSGPRIWINSQNRCNMLVPMPRTSSALFETNAERQSAQPNALPFRSLIVSIQPRFKKYNSLTRESWNEHRHTCTISFRQRISSGVSSGSGSSSGCSSRFSSRTIVRAVSLVTSMPLRLRQSMSSTEASRNFNSRTKFCLNGIDRFEHLRASLSFVSPVKKRITSEVIRIRSSIRISWLFRWASSPEASRDILRA